MLPEATKPACFRKRLPANKGCGSEPKRKEEEEEEVLMAADLQMKVW